MWCWSGLRCVWLCTVQKRPGTKHNKNKLPMLSAGTHGPLTIRARMPCRVLATNRGGIQQVKGTNLHGGTRVCLRLKCINGIFLNRLDFKHRRKQNRQLVIRTILDFLYIFKGNEKGFFIRSVHLLQSVAFFIRIWYPIWWSLWICRLFWSTFWVLKYQPLVFPLIICKIDLESELCW